MGIDEVGDESLLRHLPAGNASGEDNAGKMHLSYLSTEDMDNKENIFTASGSSSDRSAVSQAIPQLRRVKKGGGCNLRKSLAWNKAFYSEEGVLDPLELSMLSGSAIKSGANFLTGINEDVPPLKGYGVSSPVNLDRKVRPRSALDEKKQSILFSTFDPLDHKDTVPHVVPKKGTGKDICRNIPRAPAAASQKRLANTSTLTPVSKLPKFTATKLHASSHTFTARCNVPTRKHSNQNVKPAIIEQNSTSKGSTLSLKKALNRPVSSSKASELIIEKKTVNETSELPSSPDMQTLNVGKCSSYLRMLQNHPPSTGLSTSVGRCNLEKDACSFSQSAQHIQACHPPSQGQAKPSGLRMPTPSLGFFGQAKIPPNGLQLQKECQTSGTVDHRRHYIGKSNGLKHMGDINLLAALGQDQPCGSESTGTKVSSISVSTPFCTEGAGCSGNFIVPSATNPSLSPDVGQQASKRKILGYAVKSLISSSEEDFHELHLECLMEGGNVGRQCGRQGPRYGHEPLNDLVLSTCNHSLLMERQLGNTLTQASHFENAGGIFLTSEDSGEHQLCRRNVVPHKYSPKKPQQGDCGRESVMHQQCEDACETSISAVKESLPDGKYDLFSGFGSGNNGNGVGRSPLSEVETSLGSRKTQSKGRASLLLCSSKENIVLLSERENIESAVPDMGLYGLNTDGISEEVHITESDKSKIQNCGVPLTIKQDQIASEDEKEVMLERRELMEKPKEVSVLLNQLKAAPFSDEWLAALETFGEDVLQMKTGAVQNSPPDKPTPEPGPWSPVKRKNQDIGPCDCTKYSKSLSTSNTQ